MHINRTNSGLAIEPAALSWRAAVTLILCGLIAMLDGADTQSIAIAAPLIAHDLALQTSSLGLVFSASLLGAALGAMGGGFAADRLGAKRVLVVCTVVFGVLQFGTAYSDRLQTLLLFRVGAGLGLGGATPCFLALAAATVNTATRARILGLIWACFPIGGFVGGFLNGWLVQNRSWHTMFLYGGVLPIIVALLLGVGARAVADLGGALDLTTRPLISLRAEFANDKTLRWRTILLCVVSFGTFATLAGIVIWMPSLMVRSGFAPGQGGKALSTHALGALVSIAAGGFLLERFGARTLIVSLLLSALLLVALALGLNAFWPTLIAMMLLGVFLGLAASGTIALAGILFSRDIRSSGIGLTMASGRVGQMVLPYMMGLGIARGLTGRFVLEISAGLPVLVAIGAYLLNRSLTEASSATTGHAI